MLCPSDTEATVCSNTGKTAYANYFVDVTDVVEKKVRAIHMMKSQKYNTKGYAKKTTEQWNGNLGAFVCMPYAEAFAIEFPEIGNLLPLSDHRKWLARADEHDLLEKRGGLQGIDVPLDE